MESKLQDTFVTAGDSGTIRFWDARRADKPSKYLIFSFSSLHFLLNILSLNIFKSNILSFEFAENSSLTVLKSTGFFINKNL